MTKGLFLKVVKHKRKIKYHVPRDLTSLTLLFVLIMEVIIKYSLLLTTSDLP